MVKRSVSDVPIYLDAKQWLELESYVSGETWKYKSINKEAFRKRDRALLSLLILTGLRASEIISLKKLQFRVYPDHLELVNVSTKKRGETRKRIVLPKQGRLSVFTEWFENWLNEIPQEQDYIFPRGQGLSGNLNFNSHISRVRVFQIISHMTGQFPHWFRGIHENIMGRIFQSAYKLQKYMGLKRLDSTLPYIQEDWEKDIPKLYKI